MDGGTPKRGDRIPLTISFNATCQESGGIFVNETSGEVFFRAPGLTVSEYRKLLDIFKVMVVISSQFVVGNIAPEDWACYLFAIHKCVELCSPVR